MTEHQSPVVGDKVRHNNGYLAEVIGLGSIATNQGLVTGTDAGKIFSSIERKCADDLGVPVALVAERR